MQNPFDEKVAFSFPCKPTETCIDYDDYDPCESNEDITDKDLAILLKEETAKLQRKLEQEKAEPESKEQASSNDAGDKRKEKSQADFKEDEVVETASKKKKCKFIKNPFFTNRLKLSTSHLPLPPPGPPPQNFPLAIENEPDPKPCKKLKKKCKKNDNGKSTKSQKSKTDSFEKESSEEKEGKRKEEKGKEEKEEEDDGTDRDETTRACESTEEELEKDHCICTKSKKKIVKKTPCKKDERPSCKKKESEVSVNFGPRNIPLQLKDLPETSPKDIPEVERQILMACGKNQNEDCKRKCKKKDNLK